MKRVGLVVAYDGTNYCGWQIQPNGLTVEEVLNKKISALTGEDIKVIGASRTDSGVHALGNVAVFDTESSIPPQRFAYALNQKLPEDIVITDSREVPADWHPRYQDNISKIYEYHIYNGPVPDPMKRCYAAHYKYPLDIEKMRIAAKAFIGEHDFIGFASSGFSVKTTVREIYSLDVDKNGDIITIDVVGNGFLYNMVRIIAGTLVFVGGGKINPNDMTDIINSKDRERAGITAPPQGLCLKEVYY